MVNKKEYFKMVNDAIEYLVKNTDITFLTDGSMAKAFVETNCLEVSRLQDYVSEVFKNAFINTATGFHLDLWGETLGLPRITGRRASANIEDGAVRFYVTSGTLGTRLPNPINSTQGIIQAGTRIYNTTRSISYTVLNDVAFPKNAKTVSVPVIASDNGSEYNVGANQLTLHNLDTNDVYVINDLAISSGADIESDQEYRFRLSRAMSSRFGNNPAAIEVASMVSPGVASSKLMQYSRGAGTYDVLLVPRGNKLTPSAIAQTNRALEQVTSYGISFKVREPEYVPIRIALQIIYKTGVASGKKQTISAQVQSSVLAYIGTIPMGGELVINQLRSVVMSVDTDINDIKILELYVNCRPRTLRNIQLREDELFIPDEQVNDPIQVV
jgi:uncharacterized phage protein gp47/JayE